MKFSSIIGSVILLSTFASWAGPRTVNISAEGMLKLTNPTAVAVTYSITCKNKTGTAVLPATTETLAAGNSKTFGSPSNLACKSGTTPNTNNLTGGAAGCFSMAGIQHPNASTFCEPGFHVCSIPDIATVRTSLSGVYGHISTPSTFSYRHWDMGMGMYVWSNTTSSVHIATLDSMGMVDMKCATGSSGSGTVIDSCSVWNATDPMTMNPAYINTVMCCPDVIGISHCSVTIDGSTPTAGHLISPQFKGGSPF